MSFGNCSICGKDAVVIYPLLSGEPAFCMNHHNQSDAGRFGCDTGPSDAFIDAMIESITLENRYSRCDRDKDGNPAWITAKGEVLAMKGMVFRHLQNCYFMLERLGYNKDSSETMKEIGKAMTENNGDCPIVER